MVHLRCSREPSGVLRNDLSVGLTLGAGINPSPLTSFKSHVAKCFRLFI